MTVHQQEEEPAGNAAPDGQVGQLQNVGQVTIYSTQPYKAWTESLKETLTLYFLKTNVTYSLKLPCMAWRVKVRGTLYVFMHDFYRSSLCFSQCLFFTYTDILDR